MSDRTTAIRDHRALRLLGWLLAAIYTFWLLRLIATRVIFESHDGFEDPDAISTILTILGWLSIVPLVLKGFLVWGLVRAVRSTARSPVRLALEVAAVATAGGVVIRVLWQALSLAHVSYGDHVETLRLTTTVVGAVGSFALVIALLLHGRRLGAAGLVALCGVTLCALTVGEGMDLIRHFAPDAFGASGESDMVEILGLVTAFGGAFLMAAAAFVAARAARTADTGGTADAGARPPASNVESAEWLDALRGLRLYRSALLAKIGFLVFSLVLMVVGGLSRSPGGVKGGMVFGALTGFAASLAMFVGLIRFGRVPRETGAVEPATATVMLWGLGLLVEAWALFEVFRFLGARGWDVLDVAQRMRYVELAGQAIALVTLLVLLVALKRVAEWVAVEGAARRVTVLRVMVVLVVPFAVLFRMEKMLRHLGGANLVALAVLVLALAVTMVSLYVGFLGQIIRAVEEGGAQERSPEAVTANVAGFEPLS